MLTADQLLVISGLLGQVVEQHTVFRTLQQNNISPAIYDEYIECWETFVTNAELSDTTEGTANHKRRRIFYNTANNNTRLLTLFKKTIMRQY